MTLNYDQKRLIVLIRKRIVTDTLAWFLLWLLTIGYIPIHIYSKYDVERDYFEKCVNCITQQTYPDVSINIDNWMIPIWAISMEAALYVLAIAVMVYINLKIIKRLTLDKKRRRSYRYMTYLVAVAVSSVVLAFIWWGMVHIFPDLLCMRVEIPRAAIIHFAFALISTGLVYLKDLQDIQMEKEELEIELENMQSKEEAIRPNLFDDHIKVGSKNNWELIYLKDILYLKASNNDTRIYTETNSCWGRSSIKDFEELLPKSLFIRVSRSYIVAKKKVAARNNTLLIIKNQKGEKMEEVKITDSYKEAVDTDSHLGWEG